MQGLAGLLAKTTGNALWGMFAMDPALRGSSSIHYRPRAGKRLEIRKPKPRPYPLPAIDLAEIVAGRVRARIYEAMVSLGNSLVCAHTDGLWSTSTGGATNGALGGWRIKDTASEMQLLTPQAYRYWSGGAPSVIFSGVPVEQSHEAFERAWKKHDQ